MSLYFPCKPLGLPDKIKTLIKPTARHSGKKQKKSG
jgi:hypothetical protein